MKNSLILATATIASAQQQLFNLRNSEVLGSNNDLQPLESLAHLTTLDPIPVFGGHELRQKMLSAQGAIQEKASGLSVKPLEIARDIQRGFGTITKTAGCAISTVANVGLSSFISGDHKLEYARFCGDETTEARTVVNTSTTNSAETIAPTVINTEQSGDSASAVTASLAVALVVSAVYLQ